MEVPYGTLRDRLNGHEFQLERRHHNHRLSQTQEDYLVRLIVSRDQRGCPPQHSHVAEIANLILKADSSVVPEPIGQNWVTKLIARRDEVKSRFARQYYYQRALCEDPKIIQKWFNDLKELRFTKGILDEDIYNFDETGFAMGRIGTTKVVSRSNMPGRPLLIQPGSREWVTTIECINTRGWSVLTCIIFKGKAYIKGWYAE